MKFYIDTVDNNLCDLFSTQVPVTINLQTVLPKSSNLPDIKPLYFRGVIPDLDDMRIYATLPLNDLPEHIRILWATFEAETLKWVDWQVNIEKKSRVSLSQL